MKRISFYAKGNRSGNLLHIETDGCTVNIRVGLHDADGRQVTSVRVSPDNYAERGGRWVVDGSRVVQLLDGETALPVPAPDPDDPHSRYADDPPVPLAERDPALAEAILSPDDDEAGFMSRTGETYASYAANHMYDPPRD